MRLLGLLLAFLAGSLPYPAEAQGQAPSDADVRTASQADWNDPAVLELMRRARETRQRPVADTALQSYQAEGRGFVYFFLDRPGSSERTLIKADQVALDLYWAAPNRTQQTIVGLRDEEVLPTNIRYHLDHLTVVQDDFGDWITLGEGDEVSRVLHPMGPGAPGIYDYRLADSLTLRYGGDATEVRVYEVEVRPKAPEMPGFVGSVYLDRQRAAIVRMGFTFTPSSYLDPYLDHIRISLDNALWLGDYWLPYQQVVELRRELPIMDLQAGSIIRGRFEIGGYTFNEVDEAVFQGAPIRMVPEAFRADFPFERGLYDDLEREGLTPAPPLEEVRSRAQELLREQVLSGLAPARLHLPSLSRGLRYNRAEGLFVGGGLHLRPGDEPTLHLLGGWAFGADHPTVDLRIQGTRGPLLPELRLYWNDLRDLGPHPTIAPTLNGLATALLDRDYLDPFYARGGHFELARPGGARTPRVRLTLEDHEPARRTTAEGTRPVRPVEPGLMAALTVGIPLEAPAGGRAELRLTGARQGDASFVRLRGDAAWRWTPTAPWSALELTLSWGLVSAGAPVQHRWYLGGRGTLDGHRYRRLTGRAFWLARATATRPIRPPFLGVRALAAVGGTHLEPDDPGSGWPSLDQGIRASVGAGLSLGWDVLRLDLLRGLGPDGGWELSFSVRPDFSPWL